MRIIGLLLIVLTLFSSDVVYGQVNLLGSGMSETDMQMMLQRYNSSSASRSPRAKTTTKKSKKDRNSISKVDSSEAWIDSINLRQERLAADTIVQQVENVYGQKVFSKARLELFSKTRVEQAPDNYILGNGDEIMISIWGNSLLNKSYKVASDGSINPKRIGKIFLKGLSLEEVRKTLKKKLKSYYDFDDSNIRIEVLYSRDLSVHVVGEVNQPGTYQMKGFHTAFNALYAAQGMTDIGSVRNILIRRQGTDYKILDLYKFLMDPTVEESIYLEEGDFIIVPAHGNLVTIEGEINRPAQFELKDGEGIDELIKYAGGKTPRAYCKNIQITRIIDNKEKMININLEELQEMGQAFPLQTGDKVLVRSIPEELQNFVNIEGAVKIPGQYELIDSMTISDLVTVSEGLLYDSYIKRAYLVRVEKDLVKYYKSLDLAKIMANPKGEGDLSLQPFDNIIVFSKSDFIDEDSVMINGAVRKPGNFVFGEGMNLKDLLYLSGGLKKEAAISRIEISRVLDYSKDLSVYRPSRTVVKIIEVDFEMGVTEDDALFELKPMDQINVRIEPIYETHQNVTLLGEVNYPGTYTLLTKNDRLLDVLIRAGGLTNWAFPEGAKLYRSENKQGYLFIELQKLMTNTNNSKYNYVLRAGDTLIVPKINNLVSISGGIEYPGIDTLGQINAPYTKGRRAKYYVKRYGVGFNRKGGAMKRKTMVELPSGIVKKTRNFGVFKIYPRVVKGSEVIVPVKKPKIKIIRPPGARINWERVLANFSASMTALATVVVLAQSIQP